MDRSLMPPPETVHICLWTGTRAKWSVEAVTGIIEYGMKKDPYSGDIYMFQSRDRTIIYAYRWAGDGWCEWKKKNMTKRRYHWPEGGENSVREITA